MDQSTIYIIKTLQQAGHEAYLVGGCVRDHYLGIEPKDYDIVTSAFPETVESLFETTNAVGKSFGVILVRVDAQDFEVATFRADGEYQDGRRPESIEFSTREGDSQRRDFTINALLYDPITDEYFDHTDGLHDLQCKVLRFIGDPDTRIREDFLRILRAVRFRHRFSMEYAFSTERALAKHASLVTQISTERILEEMNKILVHESRGHALRELYRFGILQKLFPNTIEMERTDQPSDHHLEGDVLTHTFLVLDQLPVAPDLALCWAAFFHDFAKPLTKVYRDGRWRYPNHDQTVLSQVSAIFEKYNFAKKLSHKILWLLEHKPIFEDFHQMKLSTRLKYFDHLYFPELWQLERADIMGSVPENKAGHDAVLKEMNLVWENYNYAHSNKILPSYKKEFFTGKDIMKITGLAPGKQVGEVKDQLRTLQLEGEIQTKDEAEVWLRNNKLLTRD